MKKVLLSVAKNVVSELVKSQTKGKGRSRSDSLSSEICRLLSDDNDQKGRSGGRGGRMSGSGQRGCGNNQV